MLMRGFFFFALTFLICGSLIDAMATPKRESASMILSRLSDYKSWKQVNRFDFDVTAASFKIENSLSFGGG